MCTNDVHYLHQDDVKPHDILLCIGTGKKVLDEKRLKYHGDQFFLKTAAQMAAVFGDHPEALRNTHAHRRALRRHHPQRQAPHAGVRGAAGVRPSTTTSPRSRAKASSSACRG